METSVETMRLTHGVYLQASPWKFGCIGCFRGRMRHAPKTRAIGLGAQGRRSMMHGHEKLDLGIVAMKPATQAKKACCGGICGGGRSGVGVR
jgi:hypothetical protein